MRRAKIVATLGPATSSYERILELVEAGMDVARLNLSHGSYDDHAVVYNHVRRASDESGRGVGIIIDWIHSLVVRVIFFSFIFFFFWFWWFF